MAATCGEAGCFLTRLREPKLRSLLDELCFVKAGSADAGFGGTF